MYGILKSQNLEATKVDKPTGEKSLNPVLTVHIFF